KTSIFSHPVYLFLRKFSLQDSRGGSHDLEILGKVFVVAEAATTVKMGTGSATAVLPVVKRLKFTKTEA
ncbi:hypothetical protein LAV75_21325, partial [Shigella flexneri]|nr:hypothetical protein [Shigella flexneri]